MLTANCRTNIFGQIIEMDDVLLNLAAVRTEEDPKMLYEMILAQKIWQHKKACSRCKSIKSSFFQDKTKNNNKSVDPSTQTGTERGNPHNSAGQIMILDLLSFELCLHMASYTNTFTYLPSFFSFVK